MHEYDWIEKVRRELQVPLHGALSEVGLYAMAETDSHRYACTVYHGEEQLEKQLDSAGFLRNPLAALKYRKKDGNKQISEGSWFYFTMEDPVEAAGLHLPKYQYHLTIYDVDREEAMDCYIHKELWWGTSPSDHYSGEDVESTPQWLRNQFDMAGIEYKIEDTTK